MNVHNFMADCQYEFDDIKTRIRMKLLRRDVNLNIIGIAPFIEVVEDNILIVFYVDLGYVNRVNIGFYINNEHLKVWQLSKKDVIKKLLDMGEINFL